MSALASFKGVTEHSTNNPDTLMHHAEMARSRLWTFSLALAEQIGISDFNVQRGPQKLRERFEQKAKKYNGNYCKVPDLVRNRILFKSVDQIFNFRSLTGPGKGTHPFLLDWEKRGIYILEVDDAFLERKKSGAVGINVSVGIDLGKGRRHVCEIQFMHENMQQIDLDTRYNYDNYIRPVTDRAHSEQRELTAEEFEEIAPFQQANRDMYDAGIIENGLVGLLSEKEFQSFMDSMYERREQQSPPAPERNQPPVFRLVA